jgi:hypothetical protein
LFIVTNWDLTLDVKWSPDWTIVELL